MHEALPPIYSPVPNQRIVKIAAMLPITMLVTSKKRMYAVRIEGCAIRLVISSIGVKYNINQRILMSYEFPQIFICSVKGLQTTAFRWAFAGRRPGGLLHSTIRKKMRHPVFFF